MDGFTQFRYLTSVRGYPKIRVLFAGMEHSLVDVKEKDTYMTIRRILAASLAAMLTLGVSPVMAQQASGIISGKATDEAKQPYSDYNVQLRDAKSGQVVGTALTLNPQGQFSFSNVEISRSLLVELVSKKQNNKVICTEGPYTLTAQAASKTDVNIDCGKAPAALWLLAAGAGTAAALAIATRSASQ